MGLRSETPHTEVGRWWGWLIARLPPERDMFIGGLGVLALFLAFEPPLTVGVLVGWAISRHVWPTRYAAVLPIVLALMLVARLAHDAGTTIVGLLGDQQAEASSARASMGFMAFVGVMVALTMSRTLFATASQKRMRAAWLVGASALLAAAFLVVALAMHTTGSSPVAALAALPVGARLAPGARGAPLSSTHAGELVARGSRASWRS